MALVYKVEDRSVLLPFYKKLFIAPVIGLVPARVNPNAITHAGHVVNLLGTLLLLAFLPKGGALFAVAAFSVQLYNWCDNADGAHARRTGQCSAMGEFLDHGLDVLNTTYIGWMAALSVDAPPLLWVALALVIPAVTGVTYWEQAETGIFRVGRINQVESVMLLSAVLLVAAVLGTAFFTSVRVGSVTLQLVLIFFVLATAFLSMAAGMIRVVKLGAKRLAPVGALVFFGAALMAAAVTEAIPMVAAVIVATAGNVYFATRMLGLRLRGELPRVEPVLLAAGVTLLGLLGFRLLGNAVPLPTITIVTVLACLLFGGLATAHALDGVRRVLALDREPDAPAKPTA